MWTRQHKKRNTGRYIVPAFATLFLGYFGFHAFNGEYGIYSKYQLEERKAVLLAELDRKRAVREELEQRVQQLRDGTIEKDMLDEQARRALNLSAADEITIMRSFSIAN